MNINKNDQIHVLIVDDSAFARSVGRQILMAAGVNTILEVSNGREALDLLRQAGQSIHIVFTDLMMPDMDGVQFIRHAAALPVKPAFTLVSGADSALLKTVENVARARNLRILDAVQKPLTFTAVLRSIERFANNVSAIDGEEKVTSVTADELKAALTENQFLLHFQPKVSLLDGALDGFESLSRWRHPERGVIPPGIFIAAAEKTGMIGALTNRTTTMAIRQCAAWAAAGLHTKVSVNLSAYMLADVDFPDRLASEVAQFKIDPSQLILEITELGLFQDVVNILEILARLHMKGFKLSIDDFGTGYSSMEQLSRVPFAEMKIDGAFVRGVAENARAKTILESSAELARSLAMTVVAEGAETQEDWDMLRKARVDFVQGYFVAKPMAAEDVLPWVSTWAARRKPDLT